MGGSYFLDSNVLIYLLEDDKFKKEKTMELVFQKPKISIQVINENINVCIKKFRMKEIDIRKHVDILQSYCSVDVVTNETSNKALFLSFKYKYSYYDSLILSSALENKCDVLFSEDFQNNQLIENSLKIINPFAVK
ncbi:MAG: PIN domain-containing protein [bacterium]|nr:PIN domain-containing protein [bacterium]